MDLLLLAIVAAGPSLPMLAPGAPRSSARCLDAAEKDCPAGLTQARWDEFGLLTRAVIAAPDAGVDATVEAAEAFVREHHERFGLSGPVEFVRSAPGTSEVDQLVAGAPLARLTISASAGVANITGHHWPLSWKLALTPEALVKKYDRQVFLCAGAGDDNCSLYDPNAPCDGKGCDRPKPTAKIVWRVPPPELFLARRDCFDGRPTPPPAQAAVCRWPVCECRPRRSGW